MGHREFRSGLATVIYDDEMVGTDCEKLFHDDWLKENTGCTSLQRGTAVMFEYRGLGLVFKRYHRGGLIGRIIAKTYRYRRLKKHPCVARISYAARHARIKPAGTTTDCRPLPWAR